MTMRMPSVGKTTVSTIDVHKVIVRKATALTSVLMAAIVMSMSAVSMDAKAELVEGRDYRVVSPAKLTRDPKKIEVLEYFSWGCSHCYEFYPVLSDWAKKTPKDVILVKSAVTVGIDQWIPLARAFYAFDYSGDIARLDELVFKAIHEQHVALSSDEKIAAWAERQGIDGKKFLAATNSMGVTSKWQQAEADSRSIPIEGTPTLVVDGKYVLLATGAKSYAEWMPLLDQLIAKVRTERADRKKVSKLK